MTRLTQLVIGSNYPDNILILSDRDSSTNKYTSLMYLLKSGEVHNLLLSFDGYSFDTQEAAISKMKELAIECVKECTA